MCDQVAKAEAKLKDLNAQIKNKENTLRQVTDAVKAMNERLQKLEEGKLKPRGIFG